MNAVLLRQYAEPVRHRGLRSSRFHVQDRLQYSAAGHPPMLLLRHGKVIEIAENGLILAAFDSATYTNLAHPLEPGDRLLLYTDGLIEAANAKGDFFGQDALSAVLGSTAALAPPAPRTRSSILGAAMVGLAGRRSDGSHLRLRPSKLESPDTIDPSTAHGKSFFQGRASDQSDRACRVGFRASETRTEGKTCAVLLGTC
jgi:hypothetical protein